MNYKDLIVWQKSIELSVLIYKLTSSFPSEEKFGLTSQIRRSSVSIPSNIAEGFGRVSKKYFLNFLKITMGSICELETQLILAEKLKYIKIKDIQKELSLLKEVEKITGKLIKNNK